MIIFTKTGSGQTYIGKTLKKEIYAFYDRQASACHGIKNASLEPFYTDKRSFFQDRLGTNIGKAPKKVRFS
jgi:hypothetical protein